jgi:hypothetical protein
MEGRDVVEDRADAAMAARARIRWFPRDVDIFRARHWRAHCWGEEVW